MGESIQRGRRECVKKRINPSFKEPMEMRVGSSEIGILLNVKVRFCYWPG